MKAPPTSAQGHGRFWVGLLPWAWMLFFFLLRVYAWMGLLEAARDLGARPATVFLRVTLPLSRRGIVAGSMLVFIPAVGEFVIPDLLGGGSVMTIGRSIWDDFGPNQDWPMAAAVAVVMVRAGAYPGSHFFAGMMSAPVVMPEVVVGLSLVLLFTHPALAMLGGRGVAAIWVAHTTLCAAYVAVLVASRLREMDRAFEEAALDLGCPPLKVFFVITVPVIAPALAAGWLLAFTLSMDDFVLAAMLSDPGSTTLPVLVFARLHHGLKPEINALATVIVVVVSIAVLLANRLLLAPPRAAAQSAARGG